MTGRESCVAQFTPFASASPLSSSDVMAAIEQAAAVWVTVCDDVLAGFTHAVNNRLAALGSIARVIDEGDPAATPFFSNLLQEIDDLEQTVQLLRALPWTSDNEPEHVHVQDCLRSVVDLQRLRRDTRDLEYRIELDPATPPVFAEPVLLNRALLLVLGEVAAQAVRGGSCTVTLETKVADGSVILRLAHEGGSASPRIPANTLAAARTLLETCGGTIPDPGSVSSGLVEIHLPAGFS